MDDERYYENPARRDIAYNSTCILKESKLTDKVSVVTKSYRNRSNNPHAQIETFIISSDERVRSKHVMHKPYNTQQAKKEHAGMVIALRRALGLAPEYDPIFEVDSPISRKQEEPK